jgi:sugar phosphate isomerase/epimerase
MSERSERIAFALASLAGFGLEKALRTGTELGFKGVAVLPCRGQRHSLGEFPGFDFADIDRDGGKRISAMLAGFPHKALHAPFLDLPLFTYNQPIAAEALRQTKESIRTAAAIGARVVTVHANNRLFFKMEEYWRDMIVVFRELGDLAAERGVRIGIETGFPGTVESYTGLIREIDHPMVGATIDTGHVGYYVDAPLRRTAQGAAALDRCLEEMGTALGRKLFHLHLHDVRLSDWRDHREVGSGVIGFKAFFALLDRIGYEGLYEFELEEEDRTGALARSRRQVLSLLGEKTI